MKNYCIKASPLTTLLKKDAFQWNPKAQAAFESLKKSMTTTPVLALPNFNKPFVIDIDTLGIGVGTILMQNGHPMAYYSHCLPKESQIKSVYERELMPIILVVHKWRHYLTHMAFTIQTDQFNLKYLLCQK